MQSERKCSIFDLLWPDPSILEGESEKFVFLENKNIFEEKKYTAFLVTIGSTCVQKLRQFEFLTLAIKISFLFDFCTDVLLTRNFSLWYPYIILHGDGEHHQWLWDQVWFKSMASFAWDILNQNQKAFYLKAIKTNNKVITRTCQTK